MLALSALNDVWMTGLLSHKIVEKIKITVRPVELLCTQGMGLLIKWHSCISPYARLFVRYCAPHVGNRIIHVMHLPLKTLT